jgi:ZIP family zinc transporter
MTVLMRTGYAVQRRCLHARRRPSILAAMLSAFGWGFLAASSLILGAAIALVWRMPNRVLGLVMGFGSGVLISAVAYELVLDAFDSSAGNGGVAAGLITGSLVFFVGDELIDRRGGSDRKSPMGKQASGSALAIVLGTVLDGVPESVVLGMTLMGGGSVSAAFLTAVFISNLPESISATSGLTQAGWSRARILGLWTAVALVSGLAALVGFAVFEDASPSSAAYVQAFAGGAILTMLADTMFPEAYEHGGKLVGVVTTIGFGVAFALSALE